MGAVKASTMRCLYCRKKIPEGGRSHRKFCKAGCRTLAYRARKRGALRVADAPTNQGSIETAPRKPRQAGKLGALGAGATSPSVEQKEEPPLGIVDIVSGLKRQHVESGRGFGRLLDLARSAQQREANLQQGLSQTEAALRTRVSEVEQLEATVATLREQATKREQAASAAESVWEKLLQAERAISAATTQEHRRCENVHQQLSDQYRANESLRGELTSSLSRVRELEEQLQLMTDKPVERSPALAANQERQAASEQKLADLEKDVQRLQQQHDATIEANRRLLAEGNAQRAEFEAAVQRLQQAYATQQAASDQQLAAVAARLDDEVSGRRSSDQAHSERVARLTTARDVAARQHQTLRSLVREMVPLPVVASGPFEAHAARLKTVLKNPLVYFVAEIDPAITQQDHFHQSMMLLYLLFAQGRISSLMTLAPGEPAEETSSALVRHVIGCIKDYKDFYPEGAFDWVASCPEILQTIEKDVSARVLMRLREALLGALAE